MPKALQPIEWRLSALTMRTFERLMKELVAMEEKDSDEAYAIEDEIRSLPGFPHWNDPKRHIINFTITSIR